MTQNPEHSSYDTPGTPDSLEIHNLRYYIELLQTYLEEETPLLTKYHFGFDSYAAGQSILPKIAEQSIGPDDRLHDIHISAILSEHDENYTVSVNFRIRDQYGQSQEETETFLAHTDFFDEDGTPLSSADQRMTIEELTALLCSLAYDSKDVQAKLKALTAHDIRDSQIMDHIIPHLKQNVSSHETTNDYILAVDTTEQIDIQIDKAFDRPDTYTGIMTVSLGLIQKTIDDPIRVSVTTDLNIPNSMQFNAYLSHAGPGSMPEISSTHSLALRLIDAMKRAIQNTPNGNDFIIPADTLHAMYDATDED